MQEYFTKKRRNGLNNMTFDRYQRNLGYLAFRPNFQEDIFILEKY